VSVIPRLHVEVSLDDNGDDYEDDRDCFKLVAVSSAAACIHRYQ